MKSWDTETQVPHLTFGITINARNVERQNEYRIIRIILSNGTAVPAQLRQLEKQRDNIHHINSRQVQIDTVVVKYPYK